MIVIIEHAHWAKSIWLKGLFPFWDRIAIPCFMVISGFVYSESIKGKTIKEAYEPKTIWRKLNRYLIPFLFVYTSELLIYYLIGQDSFISFLHNRFNYSFNSDPLEKLTLSNILDSLIRSGYGPGNYYTPVMVQLVLLFPLMYFFMKKYKYKGLIASFLFCLGSELWQYYFHIPRTTYRLLIFRHILTICFGIYLYLGLYKKNKPLIFLSMAIGFIYIVAHSYYQWTPVIFNPGWADVNFVVCLFFMPIIAFIIQKEKITCKPIELIGRASYHIYLTQMIYYNFAEKEIVMSLLHNQYIWVGFSLLICVFFGLCFYQTEKKIRSKLLLK